jgi:hypothetical protein
LHAFLILADLFEICEDITLVGEAFVTLRGLIAVEFLAQRAHEGISWDPVADLALVQIEG